MTIMVRCSVEDCDELMPQGSIDCGRHQRHPAESQSHPCKCGKQKVQRSHKYCNECRPTWSQRGYVRKEKKSGPERDDYPQIEVEHWEPRPKPAPIMSDAEQWALNMDVEVKLARRCGYGHGPVRSIPKKQWKDLSITPIDQVPRKRYVGNEQVSWD